MAFYKFKRGDVLLNTLTARPEYNFFIYDTNRYINHKNTISGSYSYTVTGAPPGYVNLYELNIDRSGSSNNPPIYPWVYPAQSNYFRLSAASSGSQVLSSSRDPAVEVTGSYPLTSSISYYYFAGSDTNSSTSARGIANYKLRLEAMKNSINFYRHVSPHFCFSGSISNDSGGSWRQRDLQNEDVAAITIPAILTGGGIKEGSVSLKFFISGTLQGQLIDDGKRGELRQVSGAISSNDNKIAGVVLYNEGVILLTGSWTLNTEHTEQYEGADVSVKSPSWKYFGSTIDASSFSSDPTTVSSSYTLDFKATEKIPNLTMLAHANRGELNYSNNPTFISSSKDNTPLTGSKSYVEPKDRVIKNIVSSSFTQTTGSFEKITYITKVGIYDKYKNLIGVANLANPVRKREQDSFTFKLKLDM